MKAHEKLIYKEMGRLVPQLQSELAWIRDRNDVHEYGDPAYRIGDNEPIEFPITLTPSQMRRFIKAFKEFEKHHKID